MMGMRGAGIGDVLVRRQAWRYCIEIDIEEILCIDRLTSSIPADGTCLSFIVILVMPPGAVTSETPFSVPSLSSPPSAYNTLGRYPGDRGILAWKDLWRDIVFVSLGNASGLNDRLRLTSKAEDGMKDVYPVSRSIRYSPSFEILKMEQTDQAG